MKGRNWQEEGDGSSTGRRNKDCWTTMHFNTYFNDGKGFIGISTSVGERFKKPPLWWWEGLFLNLKAQMRPTFGNNGFNGWNTYDKLKTNLTQLLTRALAWRASWGCHLAPAHDVRLGTPFHFNHGFPHVWISHQRFKTQDLKLSNRRKFVPVSTWETCQKHKGLQEWEPWHQKTSTWFPWLVSPRWEMSENNKLMHEQEQKTQKHAWPTYRRTAAHTRAWESEI